MKNKLTIAFILFSAFAIQAQVKKISLAEAINYALENKAESKKATLEVENSEYLIQEARANALPQINATGTLTYNAILQKTALNFNGSTQIIEMGRPWQSTASISLNQQLFNLAVFTGLKAAKTTREFYQINKNLSDEQVIEKVANSYYEVYKTKSQITTVNRTLENTTKVSEVIESLYKTGLAKKIDLDRINVTVNNVKSTKQQLENALALRENALKYFVGMDISQGIEVEDNTFEISSEALLTDVNVNLENRTEFALLSKQRELLELNKTATRAQGLPSLSLNANYGYLGIGEKFPWFQSYPGAYWSDYSSIGLNLNIPIFNGFNIRSKVRQAQNQIDMFDADIQDTKLALDLEVRNAVTQINNTLLTLNMQKENVDLAKDVLTNIENNYKNGLASLTDLLDAETSYADAQNNYTNAQLDYKLAEVQLIKAKGELQSLTK